MRPLQPREKTILWVLAMLVIVIGFYNFVYSPKTKEYATLAVQLKAKQEELKRVQAQAARKDELERRMQDLQRDLREMEARLPSTKEIPVLLVQLERLAGQVGANLTLIRPGPSQQGQQPPAGQPPRPGGAAPSGPGAASAGLLAFGLELNAEGSYDTVQNFLRGIETFPRFIAMTDLRISPLPPKPGESALQPRLAVGVSATTYFVSESGAGR